MNITKSKTMSIAAVAIVLAVFNVIAFVIPFNRNETFWVGYSFAMLAILLTAAVGLYAIGRGGIKSRFYGVSLVFVAWTYLIVQTIAGILEMIITIIPYQYPVVLNVIMLGACLVGLIGADIGKEEVERIDDKVRGKVFYIKSLQSEMERLALRTSDEPLKESLTELADTIRYSDPVSSPQLADIENKIEAKAAMLADAVKFSKSSYANTLIGEMQQLLAERNSKCKLLK